MTSKIVVNNIESDSGINTVTIIGDVSVGSSITATDITATHHGSGADLTNLPAANLTGTLPAISGANLTGITITPTNSDIQVAYTVTANGSSAYRFAGNGVVSTADDPDLYLIRGQKYRFINNSGGSHPFQIRVSSGGSAYSTGVTNNGAASGNIDFAPTFDSPGQLVYQCTSHSGMVGNIYISDGKYDTKAAHPSFMAYGNSSWTDLNANTDLNPYVFPNTAHNIGSHYNTTSGKFTVPVTGVYQLHWNIFCASPTNQTTAATIEFYVRKNGSSVSRLHNKKGYGNMGDDQQVVNLSVIEQLSSGDEITLYVAAYNVQWRIYGGHSTFSGALIG